MRIPFADMNCLRLPGEPGDDLEHDFVLLADAFPTGYHATELAQVSPGDSVAIFGAGAIGLLAAYCPLHLRGASEVCVVDDVPTRLEKAGAIGAIPIDFSTGDPVEQILEHRSRVRTGAGSTWRGRTSWVGWTAASTPSASRHVTGTIRVTRIRISSSTPWPSWSTRPVVWESSGCSCSTIPDPTASWVTTLQVTAPPYGAEAP